MQLGGIYACRRSLPHGAGERVLDAAQALLAHELEVLLRDEAALPGHGLDEPLRLEVLVGTLGRYGADAQVRRERPDGRQALAGRELACEDAVADLLGYLLVYGPVGRVGKDYLHVTPSTRCRVDVITVYTVHTQNSQQGIAGPGAAAPLATPPREA